MNKKAELSIQILFFILMAILMVSIIVFGITKLLFVEETLDKTQLYSLENSLKETLEYCDEPINRGTKKISTLEANGFSKVCLLPDTFSFNNSDFSFLQQDEIDILFTSGENVILLDEDNQVISSFAISLYSGVSQTLCFKEENSKISVELECR